MSADLTRLHCRIVNSQITSNRRGVWRQSSVPISRYKPPPVATRRLISCSQWESDLRNGYLTNNRDRSISAINQSDDPPFISCRPGKTCWKITGPIDQARLHRSLLISPFLCRFRSAVRDIRENELLHFWQVLLNFTFSLQYRESIAVVRSSILSFVGNIHFGVPWTKKWYFENALVWPYPPLLATINIFWPNSH